MSVRGVRRALRGGAGGPRMQALVAGVEDVLLAWRDAVGPFDPTPARLPDGVVELGRAPDALRWAVPDPWARYVVHCVARFHGIVSVSSDDAAAPGGRVTRLLRPHISRLEVRAVAGVLTPATTDYELSSAVEVSFSDLESDAATSDGEFEIPGTPNTDVTPRPTRRRAGPHPPLTIVEDPVEGDDEGFDDDSDAYELLSASAASIDVDAD